MTTRTKLFNRSLFALTLAAAMPAWGNPTGATVASGNATFATTGTTLTVTNAPNTIINWQGFSIGAGETTRFVQQSSASAVLNRVTTQSASSILGSLQSNGRVFLVNPNGILFGSGAQVNTASFTATTIDIADAAFLSGNTTTSGAGSTLSFDGLMTVSSGSLTIDANGVGVGGNISFAGQQATIVVNAIDVTGGITAAGVLALDSRNTGVGIGNPIGSVTGAATLSVGDAHLKPIVVPSAVITPASNSNLGVAGPVTLASTVVTVSGAPGTSTNPDSATGALTAARAASASASLQKREPRSTVAAVRTIAGTSANLGNATIAQTAARAASVSVNLQKREPLF
jgi:filamentous hemagglutinin family protein